MNAMRIIRAGINSAKTDEGKRQIENIQLRFGIAEPGYDTPKSGVIALGNWNTISHYDKENNTFIEDDDAPSRVCKLLEKIGVVTDWEDEWMACEQCGKLVRTSPDSYGWQKSYSQTPEGEFVCWKCIDPETHLEALEGDSSNCNTMSHIDPADHGYVKVNHESFENGLYGGQAANPEKIANSLLDSGVDRFVFNLDSTGQFNSSFSVYVHESEYKDGLLQNSDVNGNDPAEMMKQALRSTSIQEPHKEGSIAYHKIDLNDGSVTTKHLTPEEFAKGIK